MDDFTAQVLGRISAIEFVLEVMLANELARQTQMQSDQFKQDLVSRPGYIQKGPVDADILVTLKRETTVSLENFVAKVATREAQIRS